MVDTILLGKNVFTSLRRKETREHQQRFLELAASVAPKYEVQVTLEKVQATAGVFRRVITGVNSESATDDCRSPAATQPLMIGWDIGDIGFPGPRENYPS